MQNCYLISEFIIVDFEMGIVMYRLVFSCFTDKAKRFFVTR